MIRETAAGVVVALVTVTGGALAAGRERPRGGAAQATGVQDRAVATLIVGDRRLGPRAFCADPNDEPIELACGIPLRLSAEPPIGARPGGRLALRFGADVSAGFATVHLRRRNGRPVTAGRALPLEATGDPRRWHTTLPRRTTLRRARYVVTILALYGEPVSLRVSDRRSAPFSNASAEFDLPVRASR